MCAQWRKQLTHETIQMGQKNSRRLQMVGKLFSEPNEPTRLFSLAELFSNIRTMEPSPSRLLKTKRKDVILKVKVWFVRLGRFAALLSSVNIVLLKTGQTGTPQCIPGSYSISLSTLLTENSKMEQ